MWGKKWDLKRNISCDAYLLKELLEMGVEFECLEMMPSWCGIPLVNCAVLCVKDYWNGRF
jgi:hypothetical protein